MIPSLVILLFLLQDEVIPRAIPATTVIQSGLNPLWIAALGVGAPLLMLLAQGFITSRTKRQEAHVRKEEKEQDWARQDEVAARVEVAAQRVLSAQRAEEEARVEVARLAAEARKAVAEKLDAIHHLVNSEMTAARTAERDALKLLLVSLKVQRAIVVRGGGDAPPELVESIGAAENRIGELDKILADRAAEQAQVDAAAGDAK